ncbi:MAG TPA: hypothetical protein VMU86_00525, partial [Steroidobacteraceae bacterium]|nr:hypothetical protein [Steroidobacteraceae bacterium]
MSSASRISVALHDGGGPDDALGLGIDELRSLQLARLQWSVRYSYDRVEPFRRRCVAAGVHPD